MLISEETPLISNLDMKENIALIKEVHHHKNRLEAEREAQETLQKMGYEYLGDLRKSKCNDFERFVVMLARASMCDKETILIQSPFSLVHSLESISKILDLLEKLNPKQVIIFLDTYNNQIDYKDPRCDTIE